MSQKSQNVAADNSSNCPICFKEFSVDIIESHASKCLFLNDSEYEVNQTKRHLSSPGPYSNESEDVEKPSKKPKYLTNDCQQNETFSNTNCIISPNSKTPKHEKLLTIPLAEKMRPSDLLSYVGQSHIIGYQSSFYQLLKNSDFQNTILWGPPGCGKTSLANVIANLCKHSTDRNYRFVKLSAAMAGVDDVKKEITIACNELKFKRRTVMFLDEIHRFNKVQQDTFLQHIESGHIILIGATTENPSYSLNKALLSRCKILVLEKLSTDNLIEILKRAVSTAARNKSIVDHDAIQWLAETSDGDARIALGGLELAIQVSSKDVHDELPIISLSDIKRCLKKAHCLYDKSGDNHYDMISALHKSLRASDQNASLYWLTRMIHGGEPPTYISRRLTRFASEDIGLEDPKALGVAVQCMQSCKELGTPGCNITLAQCTTYLARAPKSRFMEDAYHAARRIVLDDNDCQPAVPLALRLNPSTMGRVNHEKEKLYLPNGIEFHD